MSDIGIKIRLVREAAGLSRNAFSDLLEEKDSKINAIEIGRQRADHEILRKIVKTLKLDANWLLDDSLGIDDIAVNSAEFIPIPRYSVSASAGRGASIEGEEGSGFYAFNRKWLERRGLNPDRLSVISVKGDSMVPELFHDDLVVIDHDQIEMIDGKTFVLRSGDELFVKKLQMAPGKNLHLISTNKDYPPIAINLTKSADEVKVIGRVVASMHEW